jgi:glucans biosynthesis protein C
MQTTTNQNVIVSSGLEARPVTAVLVKKAAPLVYINTLRVILIALVIMLHTAVTYGSVGGWTFMEDVDDGLTQGLLSLFTIATQGFFMGLFFMISGYFTPGSYDRKGPGQFWKDRLMRLAIPFLVYSFFLQRLPNYLDEIRNNGMTLSFWQFSVKYFWSGLDAGPTWFLFALLVFNAGYTLWRVVSDRIRRNSATSNAQLAVPGKAAMLGYGLLIGAAMLLTVQISPLGFEDKLFGFISWQWAFFPQYILLFIAGILAYRNDWLNRLQGSTLRFWVWMSIIALVALPVYFVLGGALEGNFEVFSTGFHWQAIVTNLWVGFECISISMMLILWMRERHSSQSRWMASASASAFTAYWIHPLILVAISYGFSYTSIHPLIKFVIVAALAIPLSFVLSEPVRRIPGLKKIL